MTALGTLGAGQPGLAPSPAAHRLCQTALSGAQWHGTSPAARFGELRIVALGSSSTAGAGASTAAEGYVAQLAGMLHHAPAYRSAVVWNKGVGGNTLDDELARRTRDVYALNPNVVLLQSGMNDALQHRDVATFKRNLSGFVQELKAHRIQVVLLDSQYVPSLATNSEYHRFLNAVSEVGQEQQVPVLARYKLSVQLMTQAAMTPGELVAHDQLHPNDFSHWCIAEALAQYFQPS
ncbi:SGNH/GDSL hydrolase family protein [Deinococcus ruber]|uniref:SGNH/GDSL hydrolase family protein n=1 Tax=Deinococcus ruber TaxID=1848197 RepID=UPI0016663ED7|nr:SGNH/GDSL hydrolase family protein [Deinococcus ruber]